MKTEGSGSVTHKDEVKISLAVMCEYNRNGLCILSDCPCQGEVDGKLVCSSFKAGGLKRENL